MEYRLLTDDRVRVFSNPGSRVKDLYGSKIDKNGVIKVEKKGEEDLYAYIQSFKDSVDINVVLQKFANGDTEALQRRQGMYLDCTQFPKTYADVLNVVNDATKLFESLPAEIRSQYDNDLNKFIANLDQFGKMEPAVKAEIKPEQMTILEETTTEEKKEG